MKDSTLYISPDMKDYYTHIRENTYLHTNLGFLKEHNGLRPGCLHLVIGTTSGGKSTLVRTMIKDILTNNQSADVLLWLSEESTEEARKEMVSVNLDDFQARCVTVISEQEYSLSDTSIFRMEMIETIAREKPEVVILDNLTTSNCYNDLRPKQQSEMVAGLKVLAQEHQFALVIIAHTNANVDLNCNRMINMNDIRGNKSVVNLAQYCYIMQSLKLRGDLIGTITISKSREYNIKNHLFRLVFNSSTRLFDSDRAIDFNTYKELFKMRNTLG